MGDEDRARASYEKAHVLKQNGQYLDAITVLSSVRGRSFGPIYVQCFDMLAEMCFTTENGMYADKIVPALKSARIKLRGTQYLEEGTEKVIEIVLRHLRTLCVSAQTNARQLIAAPTDGDRLLVAHSGMGMAQLARQRFLLPSERGAISVASELFNGSTIGSSKRVLPIYNSTALQFIALCREFELKDALEKAADTISRTLLRLIVDPIAPLYADPGQLYKNNQIKETETDRKDFFHSDAAGDDLIRMLCSLLAQLTELRHWHQAWQVLSSLKKISDEVFTVNGAKGLKMMAYKEMAATFWSCSNLSYHGYCLAVASSLATGDRTTIATQAVFATLCAPAEVEEGSALSHRGSATMGSEVPVLFNNPNTARAALLNRLRLQAIFTAALPEVQTFVAHLESSELTDFAALHRQVTEITQRDPEWAQYEAPLHEAVLCRQLELVAARRHRVDLHTLALGNGPLTDLEYVHTVEPLMLRDEAVLVEIDSKTSTVAFRNSMRSKLLSTFAQLAGVVEHHNRVLDTDGVPVKRARALPKKASITVNDLLAAHERSQAIHLLQSACRETAVRRKEERKKQVNIVRTQKLQERQNIEMNKRDRAKKSQEAKLMAEYRERQRQERAKLVLAKLRAKHPGLKVDNSLALKSASAMEDELALAVAAFKRKGHELEQRDTLRANLFQRALRRKEIPKRKEMEKRNAAQHAAERVAARENFLAQHRREFEKRQQEKAVLQKFLDDATAFEEQWRRLRQADKASKRDEQQSLLQQEMQRLAAQS